MSVPFHRLRRLFVVVSVVTFCAVLLFALLNVLALPLARRARTGRGAVARHGMDRLQKAYPDLAPADIEALLAETAKADLPEYEPFTEFRPVAMEGRFVRVRAPGFRVVKDQAPWPPRAGDEVIFVFGGSTAFGFALPEDQTIPSRMQELLRARRPSLCVYAFGRPGYYSSQERILFEQVLVSGFVPRAAVFLDGLNEFLFRDDPAGPFLWRAEGSDALRRLTSEQREHQTRRLARALLARLPLSRLLASWFGKRSELPAEPPKGSNAEAVAGRYLRNRELIEAASSARGVVPLFVWQPIPTYRYDTRHHLFADRGMEVLSRWTAGYERLGPEKLADRHGLWLADMQEGRPENLYVDPIHYDAAFSNAIAERIAERVDRLLGER